MIDPDTPEGVRALAHLEADLEVRLTTFTADGQPQTAPVWFLWSDGEVLIFSRRGARRIANLRADPHVELGFDDRPAGARISIEAEAHLDRDGPPADRVPAYMARHGPTIASYGWSPSKFANDYPDPVRIRPIRVRVG
jgi:PPOX class probable F420-dependent enzyme